ncbi:LOW QUALITY PROTEIN: hypothetical protein HZS_6053 [Henneguya salminicola]|nr:LOW QUALITY PROTEIN: hypothetical protein HZS_6053 [Henneguya salminicola]
MKNNNESPLNSNSNISTEPLKLLGKHSPKEEKLNKNILDDNKEFMKNIVCPNTVDVPTEPIAIHRLILSKSSKLVVVMMPQVNKVLKNIFQIMSQANYYLQKFGIIAKRFNGEQLMSLKIMSLVKNDVKVCSYISYEESQTLMNAFTRNPAIKKNGDFYYTECINLDRSDINFKKPLKLEFDISIETPMHVTENNKIILNIINRNETKFVLIDSLLNVIGCENEQKMQKLISDHSIHIYSTSTNTTVNEYHQAKNTTEYKFIEINDSIFIMKIFLPRIAQCDNFESLITYNLINDIQIEQYPKDNKSNIELQKPLHIGEKKLPSNEVGIDLNVYLLSGDKIVAMPDINKIIRTAHGCLSKVKDIPGVHGALLRQVNYYLGKLKTQKKKFNFGQMKAVKHFGTEIGNATYCSYVSLEDATKIFDIFKTFSLKFPSQNKVLLFLKIITASFNGPISLDDSVLIRINKAKITSKKTRKKDKREKIFNEENRHKIKV